MTLPSALSFLAVIYAVLLGAAAVQDVVKLRIANLFGIAVLLVCAAALIVDPGPHWWQHLLSFAIVLGLGIFLFSIGWFGGGDAKLMAAAALAFDLGGLIRFVPLVLIGGGIVALLAILVRMFLGKKRAVSRRGIPYGVAVTVGAVLTVLLFPSSTPFAS